MARRGPSHHRARLSTREVRALVRDYYDGLGGYAFLARLYGCGTSTVRDIVKGRTRGGG